MHGKVFLIAIIAAIGTTAHSALVWEQTQLELKPAIGENTAVGQFKYQNKGDKPVTIKSVTTTCGCTAATAKNSAAPGEKGEVTATFTIGNRTGVQQKNITVATDDPAQPSTTLTLKVVIPQLLELKPAFVFWQAGEEAKAKTILAKAGEGISIKNLEVTSSNPDFVVKVEGGSSAGEFRINVEPRQTAQGAMATLTIKPILPSGPSKISYATARVTPHVPVAKSAVPSGPTPIVPSQQPAATTKIEPSKAMIDPCTLLTSKEIEAIQGEPLKDVKPSTRSAGGFSVSQCYFALPTSSNSISLMIMQKGDGTDARDPKQFWEQMFHRELDKDKNRTEEAGEKPAGPEKLTGLGDEAFWLGTRVGGELYVLKGNSYIRVSVGGSSDQASKIKKSKDLALMVLKRL